MGRGETREEFAARKEREAKSAPATFEQLKGKIVEAAPTTDFLCGLRKVAPGQYAVVTGRIVDGKADVKVDHVAQPLDHAALALAVKLRAMIGEMP